MVFSSIILKFIFKIIWQSLLDFCMSYNFMVIKLIAK